jgi:tRNA (cmo5U34)-methyltransferase
MSGGEDNLYAEYRSRIEDFEFDARVSAVFEDMIRRSVPGYGTAVAITGVLAGNYARAGTRCYDLGCSTGASTLAMCRHIPVPDCRVVAVDRSPDMVEKCRRNLALARSRIPVDLVCGDIRDVSIVSASVVALNFTLQFLPVADRNAFISRIYEGLIPGGALILSEKVEASDPADQALLDDLHHAFKRANGYSDMEIAGKRTALERVLVPEPSASHRRRMVDAGFRRVVVWMQCLNFVSFLALK